MFRQPHILIISLLLLISFGFNTFGEFPQFKSNTRKSQIDKSPLKDLKKYDFAIIYSKSSYWSNEDSYYVIASKKGKWNAYKKTTTYTNPHRDEVVNRKKIKLKITRDQVDSLIQIFNREDIWTIDSHDLEVPLERYNDTLLKIPPVALMTDGVSWRFDFKNGDSTRIVYSNNLYECQKYRPTAIRARFINCVEAMDSILFQE